MKAYFFTITFLSIIYLTGCVNPNVGQQYEYFEPDAKVKNDAGFLKIYTASFKEKGEYSDDPVYKVYKGYTIYTPKGDFVQDVHKSYNEPQLIKLSEGEYIVIAEVNKNILNSFSIKIERGKILEIDKSMIENPFASK